jgi:hypothetical protein
MGRRDGELSKNNLRLRTGLPGATEQKILLLRPEKQMKSFACVLFLTGFPGSAYLARPVLSLQNAGHQETP